MRPRIFSLLLLWLSSALATAKSPVDYVNPLIDTHDSRWFYFSSACRPFGMVNLSPDAATDGDWHKGYLYDSTKIRCFSHIHGWQLFGVAVMPTCGEMKGHLGMDAYASDFSHADEIVHPGYHKVRLQTYDITAELTSTMRVGFHRYTFHQDEPVHILFDTGATLMAPISMSEVRRISDTELAGYAVMSPTMRRPKPFKVWFAAQFDRPFTEFGGWSGGKLLPGAVAQVSGTNAGAFVTFPNMKGKQVLLKVAISYVSLENARLNLKTELPGWDFDRVVRDSRDEWARWLGRIEVKGGSEKQRVKFYTDLWHALLGRRTVSDVDGRYCDMTGPEPVIRQVRLDGRGKPLFSHYNFDALWGSQWSLNQLWAMVYPEVMDGFCNTMVDMYRDGGLIPRGPSGGNYTYVMIGDPASCFFATAYSHGIRNYDVAAAYEGLRKNALPGGIRDHAGYEHTNASGGGMTYYVERGYVPEDIKGTGLHRDGASMTLEYAYEDWCLAQLAQALGRTNDVDWLLRRSGNYTNLWDASVQYMRPRLPDGSWLPNFSPCGTTNAAKGFTEANAAIYTHFVPQDVPGLIRLFGGPGKYVAALNRQFELAVPANFTVQDDKHELGWVDFGNEPSMAMAHLFNLAGAPWLSQKWVRAVQEQAYGGITPYDGYNGDEDQGQLGALGVLMAMGLFDVQGGVSSQATWQITTPLFDRVTIHLNGDYYPGGTFTITARNNKPENIYIQSASLNGRDLQACSFPQSVFAQGGRLELELGRQPDHAWGMLEPGTKGFTK